MMRLSHVENQAEARYNAALVDCLGNFATVLTLRLQSATRHAIGARLAEVFRPMRQNVVLNETKWCVIDLLNNAICSGLAVLYAWLTYRRGGTLPLGSAVMVYQYAQQIGGVVGSMAGNYQELVRYQADIGSADEIMATEGLSARVGQSLPGSWQEIRIEGLNFAHSGRDRAAGLVDAALTLRRGRKIALVGESGAGKSTLLRLLAGLYEADRITIAVDGRVHPDLRDFSAAATLIPQDPEIFEGSILRNITLGTDCAMSEVRDACDLAGFSAVLDALPEGLETNISERGFNLSGGQKQRLALARGILAARGSSLVMLDEPTSSLDGATEARIYGNLSKAFPDACVVSSIHRLHLLPRFDAVVLMADGQIVDTGSVSELLARQPSFEALWQKYASASHPDAANSDDSIAA
jgi:ABC-type bacteriocin/lantibiotic exporter with double-glycine peptidase domain